MGCHETRVCLPYFPSVYPSSFQRNDFLYHAKTIIFCVSQHIGVNSQFTGILFLCLSNFISISPVVKVYRRCEANRRWTSVDFSGCVLSSSEQQVLVIISLQTLIATDSSDQSVIESLHEEVGCSVASMLILDARFI